MRAVAHCKFHHRLVLNDCFEFRNGESNCWHSAAPAHCLQKVSSHDQHDCHLPIKLVNSWFLWMTGQSGQCSLVELPHHPGLPSLTLLCSWSPQGLTCCKVSYFLYIGRGRRVGNDVEIFIWAHHNGLWLFRVITHSFYKFLFTRCSGMVMIIIDYLWGPWCSLSNKYVTSVVFRVWASSLGTKQYSLLQKDCGIVSLKVHV